MPTTHGVSSRLHKAFLSAILFATLFIAACAHKTGAGSISDIKTRIWTGRISLQIQSEPPQAFFTGFELKGQAERGELTLTSPIGNVLGIMRWSPQEAELETGGNTRRFASVDALLEQTTGAAVPITGLFDWLAGKDTSINGWTADLSKRDTGRIDAIRMDPAPQTKLRIVLDQ
ncbi:MAG: outer membrane lipoprotein LolB [Polaromonas sp.]|nr:outer membrane lipoprotein LolB [Polaromonas sp.]